MLNTNPVCGRPESQYMLKDAMTFIELNSAERFTVSLFAELLFISFYFYFFQFKLHCFLYTGKGRYLFRPEKADGISCTGFAGDDSEDCLRS